MIKMPRNWINWNVTQAAHATVSFKQNPSIDDFDKRP